MASVAHLFCAPKRRLPMEEIDSVEAIEDSGFAGCTHGRKGSQRQILLVDLETLHTMDLLPGSIRENITTEGLNVNGLAIGEQVRVGPALLLVSVSLHALRPTGKNPARFAPRNLRPSRYVVPRAARRDRS